VDHALVIGGVGVSAASCLAGAGFAVTLALGPDRFA
jgi:hypothetical protein